MVHCPDRALDTFLAHSAGYLPRTIHKLLSFDSRRILRQTCWIRTEMDPTKYALLCKVIKEFTINSIILHSRQGHFDEELLVQIENFYC